MVEVIQSDHFKKWISSLKDHVAKTRIIARIRNMMIGHAGDCKPVGEGIFEARLHTGPGYRIYFIRDKTTIIVLLCGGDKSTQQRDISRAKQIAQQWRE